MSSGDWDEVDRLLDEDFYFYLFSDPDLLERVYLAAPSDWYERHPRNAMSRAIAAASRRQLFLVDDSAKEQFAQWLRSQEHPATVDLLMQQQSQLRALITAGRYGEAVAVADEELKLVRAGDLERFHDALPVVLLACGTAKLLVAEVEDAISLYAEALSWATMRFEHPVARFAREHLALAYAIAERHRQARELLEAESGEWHEPGDVRYHYQQPGIVARLLVAATDGDGPLRLPDDQARAIDAGPWWWVPIHARALGAVLSGEPWDAIHEITHALLVQRIRSAPRSLAGATLRTDLVTLYQSAGDLRQAEGVLSTNTLNHHWVGMQLARARQAWLLGNPDGALSLLHDEPSSGGPLVHQAARAVLYAEAERAASGSVNSRTLQYVASVVDASGSRISVTQASAELRASLAPLLKTPVEEIPVRFSARRPPRLTRREREVLDALAKEMSVPQLAKALHVSQNTVKSHLRALYQKLGAHNREEALWLARATE